MLYKKNREKTLSKELFENPTKEYRGTPFWSWNCRVTKELIDRQTTYLKEMGFGGYHVHARTGLDVPYLSDEFMDLIKYTVDVSKEKDMLTWLYDEDRYPSGAAGGIVTKNPVFRARHLTMTREDRRSSLKSQKEAIEKGEDYFYQAYDVTINDEGKLAKYAKIDPDETPKGVKWFTYVCVMENSGWYNNSCYVDTMNREAMDSFINVTHERYKEIVGNEFDKTVPAIFADEPQVSQKECFAYGTEGESVNLPWSFVMDEEYKKEYGCDIKDTIPEIFWDMAEGQPSKARYNYHDFVCEIFTKAFLDNVGEWCKKNGIAFTGHVMGEQWLKTQTEHLGEAMRCYRGFDIPGVDILGDDHEYMTLKQCQSAVHQYGREGMLSELYGVTGWDYSFRGHKNQGDWQAALGVTVRVPHLAWMSMLGDAKRDYPASISYQSAWYKEYGYIEDHFARLNTALTRGKPIVDVAVIHPIESYWLHWGPKITTADARAQIESNHVSIIEWLIFSQLDFDFVSESLLPEIYEKTEDKLFKIGKMSYKTVIVPALETIRKTTLVALWNHHNAGGRVIFMGECPKYMDGELSSKPAELYNVCEKTEFQKIPLVKSLANERNVEIMYTNGTRAEAYLTNYRQDNDCRWLFIARGLKAGWKYGSGDDLIIKVRGKFGAELYNTLDGTISVPKQEIKGENTIIYVKAYEVDSFLFRLSDNFELCGNQAMADEKKTVSSYTNKHRVEYSLEEDNAMVLDMAEYRTDSSSISASAEECPWEELEELQRVYNICAEKAGIPKYDMAQPWISPAEKLEHFVDLKFEFDSEIDYEGANLAIENAKLCEFALNGVKFEGEINGYFVDEAIERVILPRIQKGHNVLVVRTPIGIRTKIEWCYLLGTFGVEISGCDKVIVNLPEKIGYSSLDTQKMPFYTGNIVYSDTIDLPEDMGVKVRISEFEGALVKIFVDYAEKGTVAFDPFTADLGVLSKGKHKILFKYFGTRGNAFGGLHNADVDERWKGPNVWQTTGNKWCYEYRLGKKGIMAAPVIELYK